MRYITVLAIIAGLATVPTVEAQQVPSSRFAEQPTPRLQEAETAPAGVDLRESRTSPSVVEVHANESAVAREISARSVLTIIGAIVVVAAVLTLVL